MKKKDIVRAWRDEEYRNSLTDAEKAALPSHPAGYMDLDDETLGSIAGGCAITTFNSSCIPYGCNCHCP